MQGERRWNWKFRYLHRHSSDLRFKNKISSNRVKQQVCEKYTSGDKTVSGNTQKASSENARGQCAGSPQGNLSATSDRESKRSLCSGLSPGRLPKRARRVGTWRQHHHHRGAHRAGTVQNLSVLPLTSVESGRSFSTVSIQDSV